MLSLLNSDFPLKFYYLAFKSVITDNWQLTKIYSVNDFRINFLAPNLLLWNLYKYFKFSIKPVCACVWVGLYTYKKIQHKYSWTNVLILVSKKNQKTFKKNPKKKLMEKSTKKLLILWGEAIQETKKQWRKCYKCNNNNNKINCNKRNNLNRTRTTQSKRWWDNKLHNSNNTTNTSTKSYSYSNNESNSKQL